MKVDISLGEINHIEKYGYAFPNDEILREIKVTLLNDELYGKLLQIKGVKKTIMDFKNR